MSTTFAARLLAFYDAHRRRLPWRDRHDPWATWVSEIMLQQTRVEAVLDAFERFLQRFPDPRALAAADDDALLTAWQGLGYYRRARLLRDGARTVVARHGGTVPDDPDALGELPGIGNYTRGAIASIAFGRAEPAIDGNVERVLARHAGIDDDVKKSPGRRRIETLVRERMDATRPGDFNQAMMDLGATVCTPRSPECPRCPVAEDCVARITARTAELPRLPARRAAVEVRAKAVLVKDLAGRVLASRIAAGEINAGQLELPGPGVLVDHPETGTALADAVERRHGVRVVVGDRVARVRHGITHHRIVLDVHEARLLDEIRSGVSWVPVHGDPTPWSTPSRKALRAAAGSRVTGA